MDESFDKLALSLSWEKLIKGKKCIVNRRPRLIQQGSSPPPLAPLTSFLLSSAVATQEGEVTKPLGLSSRKVDTQIIDYLLHALWYALIKKGGKSRGGTFNEKTGPIVPSK